MIQDTVVVVVDTVATGGGGLSGGLTGLLAVLIPVIAAAAGGWVFQFIQDKVAWFESLNPGVKRVLVTVVVYGLNWLALTIGSSLHWTDLTVTGEQISNLLSSGLAFIFHIGNEQKKAKNG